MIAILLNSISIILLAGFNIYANWRVTRYIRKQNEMNHETAEVTLAMTERIVDLYQRIERLETSRWQ